MSLLSSTHKKPLKSSCLTGFAAWMSEGKQLQQLEENTVSVSIAQHKMFTAWIFSLAQGGSRDLLTAAKASVHRPFQDRDLSKYLNWTYFFKEHQYRVWKQQKASYQMWKLNCQLSTQQVSLKNAGNTGTRSMYPLNRCKRRHWEDFWSVEIPGHI